MATFASGLSGQFAAYATEFSNLMVRKSSSLPKSLAEVERAATYFKSSSETHISARGRGDPGASFVTTQEVAAVIKHTLDTVQTSVKQPQGTAAHVREKKQGRASRGGERGLKNQGTGYVKGGASQSDQVGSDDEDEFNDDRDPAPVKRLRSIIIIKS